jgi:uncharacterized membrane protein YkoI
MLNAAFIPRSSPIGYTGTVTNPDGDAMSSHSVPRTRRWLLASALALTVGTPGAGSGARAEVRDGDDHEQARRALERGDVLPLRVVLDKVERDYPGHAIKIEFEHEKGRFVYEISLLQADGRIVKLDVDAVDGNVLSVKRKGR